jgi:hypothetical protein
MYTDPTVKTRGQNRMLHEFDRFIISNRVSELFGI